MQDIGKPADCVKNSGGRSPHGVRYFPPVGPVARLAAPLLGVLVRDLRGRCRFRQITHPRQIVMWLAAGIGCSYAGIGRYLNRDHTTVMSGRRAIEAKRRTDPELSELTDRLLASARTQASAPPPMSPAAVSDPEPEPRKVRDEDEAVRRYRVAFAVQDARFQQAMLASGEVQPC